MLCHEANSTYSWEMKPSTALNATKRLNKRRMESYLLLNFLLQGDHSNLDKSSSMEWWAEARLG